MEQNNIWILTLVALAVGVLIGYLLGRVKGGSQSLVEERDQVRNELESYKEQVTSHFAATAELVNGLTEQYRRVHQHLAAGAQTLCNDPDTVESLQSSLQPRLSKEDIPTVTDAVDNTEAEELPQPPRDYAPKGAGEEGTLSERYGLHRPQPEEAEEPAPLTDAAATPVAEETRKPG